MQQDLSYFIYVAAGVAILALFMRFRRTGVSQIAIVCAIITVVGILFLISSLLK